MRSHQARGLAVIGVLVTAFAAAGCGRSGEAIARIDWRADPPASGDVRGDAVRIVAPSTGGVFPLTTLEALGIDGEGYAIRGEISYDDVQGRAYLEMWSVFPDGERFFSRTLDEDGALAALSGSSSWRRFELPFFLEGAPPPDTIELNLVLPGSGAVSVGPLALVPIGATAGAWWDDRAAGVAGAIGGSLIGVLGAVIGWLVARRRARSFTLGAMTAAVGLGAVLLAVGVVALVASQPFAVVYPAFLSGVILVAVFGGLMRTARGAYAEHELRRMRAVDQA